MAYLDDELSTDDGSRANLIEFVGVATTWRYTNAPNAITYAANVYTPIAGLSCSATGAGGSDAAAMVVTLPVSSAVVAAYGFAYPPRSLLLRVRVWQENSAEARKVWEGDVVGIAPRGAMAQARSVSLVGTRMGASIPSVTISPRCQHFLFDERCRVNPASYDHATTVAAIDGSELTVASIGGYPDDWFKAGRIVRDTDGEGVTIVGNTGAVLSLLGAFGTLSVSDAVTLYPGCDHLIVGDCLDKFNNVVNFGGHATVPDSNPFDVPLSRLKR